MASTVLAALALKRATSSGIPTAFLCEKLLYAPSVQDRVVKVFLPSFVDKLQQQQQLLLTDSSSSLRPTVEEKQIRRDVIRTVDDDSLNFVVSIRDRIPRGPSAVLLRSPVSALISSASVHAPSFSFREAAFKNGAVCRYGSLFRPSRGYASKTKKAKSRIEDTSDSAEDIGAVAKDTAVKMMEIALDFLSSEHAKLRTGRASPGMLDHITVEGRGVRTPLNHVAAITVLGLQTLTVLPYDASMIKEVEKSILNSPLGLNPQVDGATLTVPIPRLTKEHRETMCNLAGKAGESAKLTIRRARKEALDLAKKSGNLSKDESKRFEKEVEELTKKYTKSVDELCKRKEKEIMT